jgi:hypothetical protein
MRLDKKTVEVLKSFSSINPSLLFRKGDHLATISSSKTIMAKAKLDQEFSREFAIHDLSRFLGALSLFKEPDLVFDKNQVKISSGSQRIQYTYANPGTIVSAPEKDIKLPSEDIKFVLTETDLRAALQATSVLGVPEIAVVGDGEKIMLQAIDSKNDSADTFSREIGDTDKEFTVVFKSEHFKLLPGDYKVTISAKGISHLVGDFVEYWLAVEAGPSDFTKL